MGELAAPAPAAAVGADCHWQERVSNALLFLLIVGMAGSVDLKILRRRIAVARGIVLGIVCQFVILPVLAYGAMRALPQQPVTVVTLIIVCTSPGGGFSGLWCSLANADLALSVAMTTASTILCVVALPLNLLLYVQWLYGRPVAIDWIALATSVAIVVSAVATGLALSTHLPARRKHINFIGQLSGVALMAFGVAANGTSDAPVWGREASWYAGVCAPCVLGVIIATCLSRMIALSNPEVVAVAIECCYQNTGLALTVALSAFPPSLRGEATAVPIAYGLAELAIIPLFALCAWKLGWTYAPADEHMCRAALTCYQPAEVEDKGGAQDSPQGADPAAPRLPGRLSAGARGSPRGAVRETRAWGAVGAQGGTPPRQPPRINSAAHRQLH